MIRFRARIDLPFTPPWDADPPVSWRPGGGQIVDAGPIPLGIHLSPRGMDWGFPPFLEGWPHLRFAGSVPPPSGG